MKTTERTREAAPEDCSSDGARAAGTEPGLCRLWGKDRGPQPGLHDQALPTLPATSPRSPALCLARLNPSCHF